MLRALKIYFKVTITSKTGKTHDKNLRKSALFIILISLSSMKN